MIALLTFWASVSLSLTVGILIGYAGASRRATEAKGRGYLEGFQEALKRISYLETLTEDAAGSPSVEPMQRD